ncbi:hypothetical protein BJX63DRAFT_332934 [Aspergillus granulosus]|uniref:Uncharacterized protein n=1 Tax=Aspergillus granulosus TaxID=176169 RepID=A0ABR4H3D7_9EURO
MPSICWRFGNRRSNHPDRPRPSFSGMIKNKKFSIEIANTSAEELELLAAAAAENHHSRWPLRIWSRSPASAASLWSALEAVIITRAKPHTRPTRLVPHRESRWPINGGSSQEPDSMSEPFRGSAAWAVRHRKNNSQASQGHDQDRKFLSGLAGLDH